MNGKRSARVLSLVFVAVAVYLCPITRPFFGISEASATAAVLIYSWAGTFLFLFLALLEIPHAPSRIKSIAKYAVMMILLMASLEMASALAYRALTGKWAHTIMPNQNRHLFEEHPQLVGSLISNASRKLGDLTYSHNS